jgi:MFS family permease
MARSQPAVERQRPSSGRTISQGGFPRNIWVLGWVSLLNDSATEMSYWLLPQFLVSVLRASPMAFGFIEGAAETAASLSRLLSGFLSDRLGRRKQLVASGYTVANITKPLLALAQSWTQVFWIRFADRTAKGFRGAPRDALIADSVSAEERGAAFGFRQAMDSAGAILGPLGAVVLLPLLAGNVRAVFWMAGIPGLVCILLAWFAIQEVPPPTSVTGQGHVKRHAWAAVLRSKPIPMLLLSLTVFSLGNSSDLFLVLRAQNLGVRPAFAPALGLIFNAVYTLLSWPAGRLSDHIPRRHLVVAGYAVYAAVYFGFAWSNSPRLPWLLFPAYGIYYALTEGVLKAWIADLVPSEGRASVYGVFNWVTGVAAFPASLLAGWMWHHYSPAVPFYFSSALSLLAAVLLFAI